MPTATADALVGRRLEGRYRILDRIARGGMSTVYAAVDERLDRLVAVKVMNAALSNDPAFSDRFAREARAAARLTHVNVVSVYDQGVDRGHDGASGGHHVFLVMELVEGRTLRELLRERGRLSPAEAVSVMEPVLSALAAAHRAGLVHRDVKPENILLSDDGLVKVVDFGLARAVEADVASTRTGLMMGTVAYCAPEQLTDGQSDPRSDVYSAGIVLYELLTGEPPYQGETAMRVAYQHVHARVPAPSSKVRGVPHEIDELVVAATDSDPTGRPVDAAAFVAEVSDVRAALALPVTPVPSRPRATRTTRTVSTADARREHSTDQLRGRSPQHDTTVVPGRGGPSTGGPAAPPPPVVIPPPKRRHPRRRAAIITLIVLLLGVGAFFGTKAYIAWQFAHVPDVARLSQPDAVAQLKKAGYEVNVLPGQEFDDTVKKGFVLRTDPDAGSRLSTGSTVTVTVSAGPRYFSVPTVAGRSQDQARQLLGDNGITVADATAKAYSDTVPEGWVIGTNPPAATKVVAKRAVALIVSQGPRPVTIPTIPDGSSFADARKLLKAAQFKVERGPDLYSDTVPDNEVISISPSGPTAPHLSTITVTVSKGPEFVTVPSIAFGTPVDEAVKRIQDAGFSTKVLVYGGQGEPGLVISVSPSSSDGPQHVDSLVTITTVPKQ